jgi:SAM-dependent methyltransferase
MAHDHHHQDPHPHHHPAAETDSDSAAMAELLDLDAEVLHSYLSDVTAWVRELAADSPRRILDLGSGTGTGTLALLRRFEGADVIALDRSPQLLDRLSGKARALGVAGRVRAIQADLDQAWPATGPVDLAWASLSLHHLADPDRVLTEVFAALRPGGLLVVAEMDSFPRFLPDDLGLGRPGLEARCHAALAEGLAEEVPHLGSDWGPRLSKAGFSIEAERTFTIDLTAPLPAAARRYAQGCLQRLRSGLDDRMSPDDLAMLDTLVDSDPPGSVLHRDDLTVRTTRTVWVARRVGSLRLCRRPRPATRPLLHLGSAQLR